MITLYEDGLRKVVQGQTSLEEVMRVTQDQSDDDEALDSVPIIKASRTENAIA